jgi:iron complex outermembrane recepter protein
MERLLSLFRCASAIVVLCNVLAVENASAQVDAGSLDEITVTATKRAQGETVHEVPFTVTAVGAPQLEQAHVDTISDVTLLVPNVVLNSGAAAPGINNFSIRGMANYSSVPSSTPTVGVFVDGVYVGSNAGTVLRNTFDLEGVEVLRGPQGLLFGQNVTAGAILLRTPEPTETLQIHAQAGVETGPDTTFSTVVSGPLTDDGTISGKIGVFYNNDTGFFTNFFDDNRHLGKSTTGIAHGALAWRPNEEITSVLRFEDGSLRGDGPATQNHAVFSPNTFNVDQNTAGYNNVDFGNITWETRWNVGFGNGLVTNIFGWRTIKAQNLSDIDSSPDPNFILTESVQQDQDSDEVRYAGTFGPLSTTIGAYYYSETLNYIEARNLVDNTINLIGGGVQKSDTSAFFSSFDIKLPYDLTLNLGARYSQEYKDAKVEVLGSKVCSLATQSCSSYDFADSHKWSAFTPKVGMQWNPTGATNVYAFWTKGFRSGGYNLRQTVASDPPGPYNQEVEKSFEIGLKQTAFDKHLEMSVSAFRNAYTNLQRDVALTDPVLGVIQTTLNTANTTITGAELELNWHIIKQLTISANVGYLHNHWDKFFYSLEPSGLITPAQYDLKLPFLAPLSFGTDLEYKTPIKFGDLSARVAYHHIDSTYGDDPNVGRLNPVNNIDSDITFAPAGSKLSASLYGKNLTNEVTFGINSQLPFTPGQTFAPLNKGRIVGFEVRYKY